MNVFTINLFFSVVIVCDCVGNKNSLTKSETKMLDLKTDVDKIGEDLGNLALDMVKQVMSKVNIFEVLNTDYSTEDEVGIPIATTTTTTQHSITKKDLDNPENTTEEYSLTVMESPATTSKNVLEHYRADVSKKRRKRSINNDASDKAYGLNNQSCDNSICPGKTRKEQELEHQQIEDLKEEVNKLYDLVLLLRDQQKVMSLLGEETADLENDLPKMFNARNLLKVLDHVSNKDNRKDSIQKDSPVDIDSSWRKKSQEIIIERDGADDTSTHKELEYIKNDLRGAIVALNKTKDILSKQREREDDLENQLKEQKLQIHFLNAMVLSLYKNESNHSTGFFSKKENFTLHKDELLGTPLHLPKEFPFAKMGGKKVTLDSEIARDRQITFKNSEIKKENQDAYQVRDQLRGRARQVENLERLLDQMGKPKKNDIESKMLELQKEIEKKKHDEELLNQLVGLQILLAQQKGDKIPNTLSNSADSELIRKLQIAAANKNQLDSQLVDDDVKLKLRRLQTAINNFKPNEQWEFIRDGRPKSDIEIIRQMLAKLLQQQEDNINTGHKGRQREIEQLQYPKSWGGEGNQIRFPSSDADYHNNGYGYGPLGSFRRATPFPGQPPNKWYGNGPYYSPFGNQPYPLMASRMLNNNYGMYGAPSNAEYNGYYAPTGNMSPNLYQDQNFGQFPNYRSMSVTPNQHSFDPNMDPNSYGSSNFYQETFGNPMTPVPYNIGAGMEQNSYQPSSDITPNNQYNFGTSTDQKYQTSSNTYQKPYEQALSSNQYNFGTNMDQINYQLQNATDTHVGPSGYNKKLEQGSKTLLYSEEPKNAQIHKQTEVKNHFFPVLQPNVYQKSISTASYTQTNAAGEISRQSGSYSPHDTSNVDYKPQRIDNLRSQINILQNLINNLKKPDNTQKPEDKETVINLERQINELNDIINGLNQDVTPNKPNYLPSNSQSFQPTSPEQQPSNYEKSPRTRRSVADNEIDSDDDSKLYDQVVSKVKDYFFDKGNQTEERSSFDDVQRKIADLKYQLENHMDPSRTGLERTFNSMHSTYPVQNTYQLPFPQYNSLYQNTPTNITTTKNDIFTSFLLKILDKLLTSTPAIIEKLFGAGLTQLTNFGDNYADNNIGYGTINDIGKLFKSLGYLGYGPLIFLNIIDGLTTFMRILRRNPFFKNFLLPAFVLLLVAGSVLFLVWWLQPNEDYYGYNHNSYQPGYYYPNSHQPGYDYSNKNELQYSNNYYQNNNNNYTPGRSYNTPVYSRSYFETGQ